MVAGHRDHLADHAVLRLGRELRVFRDARQRAPARVPVHDFGRYSSDWALADAGHDRRLLIRRSISG